MPRKVSSNNTMKKEIKSLKPFIHSIAYLSQEAERAGLKEVMNICHAAEKKLYRYCVKKILIPESGARSKTLSPQDYENIYALFMSVSRMQEKAFDAFTRLLQEAEMELSANKKKPPRLRIVK